MTGVTKVSKAFLQMFAELANRYEWREQEIEEMKAEVRRGKGMREYLEILAQAHRDGYEQTKDNHFMRLSEWISRQKVIR